MHTLITCRNGNVIYTDTQHGQCRLVPTLCMGNAARLLLLCWRHRCLQPLLPPPQLAAAIPDCNANLECISPPVLCC